MEFGDLDAALDAAREGDEAAMAHLFRALNPPLLHYVRHRAGRDAEDLVGETWLAAAAGFARFSGDARGLQAWLFTIARRRVVDHIRSQARRPRPLLLGDESAPAGPLDTAATALDNLATDQAIAALVRDLNPDQAEAVVLRVVAGLDVAQVAEVMGRSPGSVRVLTHRALRRLSATWEQKPVTQ